MPKRVLRLAHLTDLHIQPELAAAKGVAACLHHMQSLADKPELVLTGGDTIFDCMAADAARTRLQWDLWQSVIKAECSLPIESCLGNHDVFGWDKRASKTSGSEPEWGKRWACDIFGIEKPYRSFDRAGWHFVVLDSTFPNDKNHYEARIDDAQWDWFCSDLAAVPPTTPVLVLSHIPILSASALFDWGGTSSDKDLVISRGLVHIDVTRFRDLFWKHPSVKLCLSGHLHLRDRCDYNGVTYLCNGAVSGNWWKGDHQQTKAGYAVIDLFDDGSFTSDYIDYGWQAQS
jgi:3',5'-cyclic AMP phosphodiesterase CpdA